MSIIMHLFIHQETKRKYLFSADPELDIWENVYDNQFTSYLGDDAEFTTNFKIK